MAVVVAVAVAVVVVVAVGVAVSVAVAVAVGEGVGVSIGRTMASVVVGVALAVAPWDDPPRKTKKRTTKAITPSPVAANHRRFAGNGNQFPRPAPAGATTRPSQASCFSSPMVVDRPWLE